MACKYGYEWCPDDSDLADIGMCRPCIRDMKKETNRLTGLLVKVYRQDKWMEQLTIEALNKIPDHELSEKARWEWGQLMLVIAKEIGINYTKPEGDDEN